MAAVSVSALIVNGAFRCQMLPNITFMELYKNACNETKTDLELAYILWSGRYENKIRLVECAKKK